MGTAAFSYHHLISHRDSCHVGHHSHFGCRHVDFTEMRLINIEVEHRMFFEQFNEPKIPRYAILSHTWEDDEASYTDACVAFPSLHNSSDVSKAGIEKIKQFAVAARQLGYDYIWVDTCCIDKSSSAELSEAINSMYRWYRNSSVCCIYLFDIPDKPDVRFGPRRDEYIQTLKQTRWLTRGWTLQEFLAPRDRIFYTKNWKILSYDLHESLIEATGVPVEASEDFKPQRWSVAQKMRWAAHRQTTRIEDRAYSLLGMFNVNMPLIYGEGDKAFKRLQEEIMKGSTDQTIFCWTAPKSNYSTWRGLLARDPSEFAESGDIVENKWSETKPFQLTNKGIQISFQLVLAKSAPGELIAFLQCQRGIAQSQCALYLRRIHNDNYVRVLPDQIIEAGPWDSHAGRTSFQRLFAKPDLDGSTWESTDVCPRIAGFCFADPRDGLLIVRWDERAGKYAPKHESLLAKKMFSFSLDPEERAPRLAIARCHLSSPAGDVEIWIRYDWRSKYGGDGVNLSLRERWAEIPESGWLQSQCCEWKIVGSIYGRSTITVSSWIELDSESDAYIHVEFSSLEKQQLPARPRINSLLY